MKRQQAEQYAEFISSLCEAGDLKWDWIDSLDSGARDHVLNNPSYLGKEKISGDEFEKHYGSVSMLGFFSVIDEAHLFDYHHYVSNLLADSSFQRNDKQASDINTTPEQSASTTMTQSDQDQVIIDEELAQAFLDDPASDIYEYTDISDEFTGITDEAARVLSNHTGELNLYGLSGISDSAAEILSEHEGSINLENLYELSHTAAVFLARHKGPINLDGLTGISDAVADALSHHEDNLSLHSLETLSDAAAESLSKHNKTLLISGLIDLSNTAAETLAMKRGILQLDTKRPSLFSFNGLKELSEKLSSALAGSNREIDLPGIHEISDQVAANLANSTGAWIHLNGIESLSDSQAECLARFSGDELSLNSVTELSDIAAGHLSNFGGKYLFLKGLTDISDVGIGALIKRTGKLEVPSKIRERIDPQGD